MSKVPSYYTSSVGVSSAQGDEPMAHQIQTVIFIHSFLKKISIAPVQDDYRGALLVPAQLKR